MPQLRQDCYEPHFQGLCSMWRRLQRVNVLENPPFYSNYPAELTTELDFTEKWAITLNDTVVVAEPRVPAGMFGAVVFHELVHVVQYSLVGGRRSYGDTSRASW